VTCEFGCFGGTCYPECAPADACCDDDGTIRPASYQCGTTAYDTEYGCSSAFCGADATERYQVQFCDGVGSLCTASNLQWGDWEIVEYCDADQECVYDAWDSLCLSCEYGCSDGACNECATDGHCDPGEWCDDGTCTPCDTNEHCGLSCIDCTLTSQVCNSLGTTCVDCTLDAECGVGEWCDSGTCEPCDTALHCGPDCVACSGTTPDCGGVECICNDTSCDPYFECAAGDCEYCNTDIMCEATCDPCPLPATPKCLDHGTWTECVECLTDDDCTGDDHCSGSNECVDIVCLIDVHESFDSSPLPAGWTVEYDGDAYLWEWSSASNTVPGSSGGYWWIDGDTTHTLDSSLITADYHATYCPTVTFQFNHDYNWYSDDIGYVYIQVDGGSWQELAQYTTDTSGTETFNDIATYLTDDSLFKFRFRYTAYDAWYWKIDDVIVTAP
jgi:hypothetical protein